jgi:peptidoglycan/LPS O-acetylase OafA/YrhL
VVGTEVRPEKPVKLGYQPALDGLRALAVSAVLLFHLGVPWMPGGYLGVSVFFTLSGFLITTILIRERVVTGGIDTRAFYTRRLRRLMPASLLVIFGVCVLVAFGVIADAATLRMDVLGALFQVENWVSLFGGKSYAQLFESPSPVAHFWSLAIEEQFYWLWPPVVTGLLAWSIKGSEPLRRATWALCGLFVAFSISVPLTLWLWSPDAVYFASWTRFAEILAGGALAALLSGKKPPEWVRWLGIPSLVAIVALCVVTPSGRGWAYNGGLPIFALLSCALILSLQPEGPVRSLFSTRAFVAVGRVSFGLYLFHWPVFVVLDGSRTGLSGIPLGVLRMSVTIAITVLSYFLLESPIRERRILLAPRQLVIYLGAAFIATAAFTFLVVAVPEAKAAPSVLGGVPRVTGPTGSGAAKPTVISVLGDSVPSWLLTEAAAVPFTRKDVVIFNGSHEACDAMVNLPDGRDRRGDTLRPPADCADWETSYPVSIERDGTTAGVGLLMIGTAPILDRLVNDQWVGPCDGIDWYLADVAKRVEYLRSKNVIPVLAITSWPGPNSQFIYPSDYTKRVECVRDEMKAFAVFDGISSFDLAPRLCPSGPGSACDATRKDGVHVDSEVAPAVLDWVINQTLNVTSKERAQL